MSHTALSPIASISRPPRPGGLRAKALEIRARARTVQSSGALPSLPPPLPPPPPPPSEEDATAKLKAALKAELKAELLAEMQAAHKAAVDEPISTADDTAQKAIVDEPTNTVYDMALGNESPRSRRARTLYCAHKPLGAEVPKSYLDELKEAMLARAKRLEEGSHQATHGDNGADTHHSNDEPGGIEPDGGSWWAVATPKGRVYYCNYETEESAWQLPAGAQLVADEPKDAGSAALGSQMDHPNMDHPDVDHLHARAEKAEAKVAAMLVSLEQSAKEHASELLAHQQQLQQCLERETLRKAELAEKAEIIAEMAEQLAQVRRNAQAREAELEAMLEAARADAESITLAAKLRADAEVRAAARAAAREAKTLAKAGQAPSMEAAPPTVAAPLMEAAPETAPQLGRSPLMEEVPPTEALPLIEAAPHPSDALATAPNPSEALTTAPNPSEALTTAPNPSEALTTAPNPSEALMEAFFDDHDGEGMHDETDETDEVERVHDAAMAHVVGEAPAMAPALPALPSLVASAATLPSLPRPLASASTGAHNGAHNGPSTRAQGGAPKRFRSPSPMHMVVGGLLRATSLSVLAVSGPPSRKRRGSEVTTHTSEYECHL